MKTHRQGREGRNTNTLKSNLAKSIQKDERFISNSELQNDVGKWIKNNTTRINIFMSASNKISTLNLLEVFIQCKLNPNYEGHKRKEFDSKK